MIIRLFIGLVALLLVLASTPFLAAAGEGGTLVCQGGGDCGDGGGDGGDSTDGSEG